MVKCVRKNRITFVGLAAGKYVYCLANILLMAIRHVLQRYKQGCGAGTEISGSGSSSGHLIFWLWLQHLELFGSASRIVWS